MKKSSADPLCLRSQELRPPGPSRRGAGSIPAFLRICHAVDAATRDAGPGQLAVNAAVPP